MSVQRFYCEAIAKGLVELVGSEGHHAASVCRLREGERVEVFDGAGCLAEASVKEVKHREVILQIEQMKVYRGPGRRIVIAVSVAKGERFDWLISKCTELGVDRICPVIFQRTIKQPKNPKAVERWQRIAIEAAKQCRRLFLPQIDGPLVVQDAINTLVKDYPKARILFGSLDKEAAALAADVFGGEDVMAIVGSEGGFTEEEVALLQGRGAKPVRLADTVLRVETAALAFAAVLAAKRIGQ